MFWRCSREYVGLDADTGYIPWSWFFSSPNMLSICVKCCVVLVELGCFVRERNIDKMSGSLHVATDGKEDQDYKQGHGKGANPAE